MLQPHQVLCPPPRHTALQTFATSFAPTQSIFSCTLNHPFLRVPPLTQRTGLSTFAVPGAGTPRSRAHVDQQVPQSSPGSDWKTGAGFSQEAFPDHMRPLWSLCPCNPKTLQLGTESIRIQDRTSKWSPEGKSKRPDVVRVRGGCRRLPREAAHELGATTGSR